MQHDGPHEERKTGGHGHAEAPAGFERQSYGIQRPLPRLVAPLGGLRDTSQIALETSHALQAEAQAMLRAASHAAAPGSIPDRAGMASIRLDGINDTTSAASAVPLGDLVGASVDSPRGKNAGSMQEERLI